MNKIISIDEEAVFSAEEEFKSFSRTGAHFYFPNKANYVSKVGMKYLNDHLNIPETNEELIQFIQLKWDSLGSLEKTLLIKEWCNHFKIMYEDKFPDFKYLNFIPISDNEFSLSIQGQVKRTLKNRSENNPYQCLKKSSFPTEYSNNIAKEEVEKFIQKRIKELDVKIINSQYSNKMLIDNLEDYCTNLESDDSLKGTRNPVLGPLKELLKKIQTTPLYLLSNHLTGKILDSNIGITNEKFEELVLKTFMMYEKLNEPSNLFKLLPPLLLDQASVNKIQELPERYNKTFNYLGVSTVYNDEMIKAYELKIGSKNRYFIPVLDTTTGRVFKVTDIEHALELPDDHSLLSYKNHATFWFKSDGFFDSCTDVSQDDVNQSNTSVSIENFIIQLEDISKLIANLNQQDEEYFDIELEALEKGIVSSGQDATQYKLTSFEDLCRKFNNEFLSSSPNYSDFSKFIMENILLKGEELVLPEQFSENFLSTISNKRYKTTINKFLKKFKEQFTTFKVDIMEGDIVATVHHRLTYLKSICDKIDELRENHQDGLIPFVLDDNFEKNEPLIVSLLSLKERQTLISFTQKDDEITTYNRKSIESSKGLKSRKNTVGVSNTPSMLPKNKVSKDVDPGLKIVKNKLFVAVKTFFGLFFLHWIYNIVNQNSVHSIFKNSENARGLSLLEVDALKSGSASDQLKWLRLSQTNKMTTNDVHFDRNNLDLFIHFLGSDKNDIRQMSSNLLVSHLDSLIDRNVIEKNGNLVPVLIHNLKSNKARKIVNTVVLLDEFSRYDGLCLMLKSKLDVLESILDIIVRDREKPHFNDTLKTFFNIVQPTGNKLLTYPMVTTDNFQFNEKMSYATLEFAKMFRALRSRDVFLDTQSLSSTICHLLQSKKREYRHGGFTLLHHMGDNPRYRTLLNEESKIHSEVIKLVESLSTNVREDGISHLTMLSRMEAFNGLYFKSPLLLEKLILIFTEESTFSQQNIIETFAHLSTKKEGRLFLSSNPRFIDTLNNMRSQFEDESVLINIEVIRRSTL
ncbi:hypothetical protein HOG98_02570 [bacterium]|nr:hypothetical protein [bacterium]